MKNFPPLIFGFVTLIFSVYLLADILFSKSLLKETSGTIDHSIVDIETRVIKNSRSFNDETAKFAVLRFSLKNNRQLFEVTERLEMIHDSRNQMDMINDFLKSTQKTSLLLKKHLLSGDVDVYRISSGETIVYDRTEEASDSSFFIFFLSIAFSIFFFVHYFFFNKN
ncbi:hypothetical protein [Pedobacter sp. UBA5917]|uniref:hypothetical protein n=1 Tax=Pedobacter sp. UBA5917 TaxID=1947061 RepID=UPI0025E15708|nr:hypothetical protein [Pedobacter sp. UBA5917]